MPIVHDRLDLSAASTMLGLTMIWGLNQVAIKVANAGISPAFQGGLRSGIAFGCLALWCAARRVPLHKSDGTLLLGVFVGALFAIEFVLIYVGLGLTDVARSVIYLYTAPFWVALGGHLLIPGERLSAAQVLGLLAAFAGLLLALSDGLTLPDRRALVGDALMLGAAFFWGATTVAIKATRLASVAPERVLGYQLGVSGLVLLVGAPLAGERLAHDPTPLVVTALAYQAVIVAFASYLTWFALVARYPVSKLSAFSFLTPLFGLLAGWLLLGERVSTLMGAALALVILGIWLVNRPRPRGVLDG